MKEGWTDISGAAEYLDLKPRTLRGLLKDGLPHVRLPLILKQETWQPTDRPEPDDLWKQRAGKFVLWAHEQLYNHPEKIEYLAKRGIQLKTIVKYGLGWNPGENGQEGLYRPRKTWGLQELSGDNGKSKKLWLPMGLVIPFINKKGEVIKLRIRRPDPLSFAPGTRYYFIPGGSNISTVLHPDRRAHIVLESDLDGLLIDQEAGDLVGVVVLGSCASKPDTFTAEILKRSLHVLNSLDYDKAGAKSSQWWKDNFRNCERWPVPYCKDPGEAWQKGLNIRDWIKAGLPEGLR
jgi:DNA primase